MNTQTITANYPTFQWNAAKTKLWSGHILSALPALFLLSSGVNMSMKASFVMDGFAHLGYSESLALAIGILEFACALLYAIPQTSILGAVVLTAYLGGATASHVRIGEPFFAPMIVGALAWAGLFLRDDRLRAFLPVRKIQ